MTLKRRIERRALKAKLSGNLFAFFRLLALANEAGTIR